MKKRIISGIQPSGNLHIGNYLGAIQQWIGMQDEFDVVLFVADLHAITVPQNPEDLRRRTIEVAKIYLASGLDPTRVAIFAQSHVSEHAELCWILNTIAKNGDLTKMTQFKDKSGMDFDKFGLFLKKAGEEEFVKNLVDRAISDTRDKFFSKKDLDDTMSVREAINIMFREGLERGFERGVNNAEKYFAETKESFNSAGVGLFDYPVLQAGDIMLYDAEFVPVGKDQVQHIELTRTLGRRFNKRFGETFVIPQPLTRRDKDAELIMALDNPTKKMSKSAASEYNYIALNDEPEKARKKIMKAVTDSGSEIVYRDDKPALKNLINIYSLLSGKATGEIEVVYQGKGYADFKHGLADVVVGFLEGFQKKYAAISDEDVVKVLREGADKVRPLAQKKLREVKEKVGFVL